MDCFDAVVALSDTKQKEDKYNAIFENILATKDTVRARAYLRHCTGERHVEVDEICDV